MVAHVNTSGHTLVDYMITLQKAYTIAHVLLEADQSLPLL